MSGAGDAPVNTDYQKDPVNRSEAKTTEQTRGDSVSKGLKSGNPRLTRIPTITLNDDSENGDPVIIDCQEMDKDSDSVTHESINTESPEKLPVSEVTPEQSEGDQQSTGVNSIVSGNKEDINMESPQKLPVSEIIPEQSEGDQQSTGVNSVVSGDKEDINMESPQKLPVSEVTPEQSEGDQQSTGVNSVVSGNKEDINMESPQKLPVSEVIPEQSEGDQQSTGVNSLVSGDKEGTSKKDEIHKTVEPLSNSSPTKDVPVEAVADQSENKISETVSEDQSEVTEEAEDKPDEPLDILGNGLLLKKVVSPGEGEKSRPVYSDRVTLRTEGRLDSGTVVDRNEALTFTLGDGDVVQAWDLCTALMGVGEVCELTTDSKYAYGAQGRSPDVPPNSRIVYTLELLKKGEGLELDKLSVEDRLKYGDEKRERGNYLFGRNDYSAAINSYSKALKILNDDRGGHSGDISVHILQQLVDVRMKCYNNIAAAQIKVDAFDAAIKSCDEVLKVQPENVKALFRKGKSHAAKGQTELAITVLKKAVKLDPESKIVQQELFKQTKKFKKETESEKEMYKKMFGSMQPSPTDKKKSNSYWKWGILVTGALAAVLLSVGIAVYRN